MDSRQAPEYLAPRFNQMNVFRQRFAVTSPARLPAGLSLRLRRAPVRSLKRAALNPSIPTDATLAAATPAPANDLAI